MEGPRTQYIDRDGAALAYQVGGSGPHELVFCCEINAHLDLIQTDPAMHALYERLDPLARWVGVQARGFGLSERVPYVATVEQQTEDLLAVLDAAGLQQPTVMGMFSTAGPAAWLAATHPTRVRNLLLMQPWVTGPLADCADAHGWADVDVPAYVTAWLSAFESWGSGRTIEVWDARQSTAYNRRLMGMIERCSATPAAARRHYDWAMNLDLSDVYAQVRVPTRVLRVEGGALAEAPVRRTAELIEGAEYVVMPSTPPGSSIGEAIAPVFDHVLELLTGDRPTDAATRFLGTVLFTDVAGSTELLTRVGDAEYRRLRADHERQVRLLVEHHGGRLVNVLGDGTLSLFDGPSRAVRCARDIVAASAEADLAVRAGVHTGEIEHTGMDITGLSVHVGARVAAAADGGEVLVSRTVRDLAMGTDLGFRSRGDFELKGVPGRWELYTVTDADAAANPDLPRESSATPIDRAAVRMARHAPRVARGMVAAGNALQRRRARAR